MWGPQQEVTIERNPYSFVPQPQDNIFWLPVYSGILDACAKLAEEFEIDSSIVSDTRDYFDKLQKFKPLTPGDIDKAILHRQEYVKNHSFDSIIPPFDETED
jgi:hypothetical protein